MQLLTTLCAFIFLAVPAWGGGGSLILYLDGAQVESEKVVVNDVTEIPLPGFIKEGSLRIKPLDGCFVIQVEIEPGRTVSTHVKEMARLEERRDVLIDRLKAIDLRESIFTSAARSQSGKTPRKTKANPEPLSSVRQGTEFALAQLEGVYRARRIANTELKSLQDRIVATKRLLNENIARIRMSRKGCRVTVSYLRNDLKWFPEYDFRLDKSGEANVDIRAKIPGVEKGARLTVVPSLLNDVANETFWAVNYHDNNKVESFKSPVKNENFTSIPISSLAFTFINQSARKLPSGMASCFYHGEYLGKALFKGASPGESIGLNFGN